MPDPAPRRSPAARAAGPARQVHAAIRPIGAHAPAGGGLATASLRYAAAVGAEAIQVFVTNPRAWAVSAASHEQTALLRGHIASTGLGVFVHAPYLINAGSPDPVVRERSAQLLSHCLRRGAGLGARGVVVHAGSATTGTRAGGLARVRDSVLPLLDALPEDGPDLLIEPTAGQGGLLCATIADIGPYLAALDWHPRALLCLDTCHLFAAGHDLAAEGGAAAVLAELAQVAPGRLRLVHANDSRDPCGSRRDRHENVGRGTLGTRPFWELLHHPATAGVTFVVETPGGELGQARDIATLRRLRGSGHSPGGPGRRPAGHGARPPTVPAQA